MGSYSDKQRNEIIKDICSLTLRALTRILIIPFFPFLKSSKSIKNLKYVFISHAHNDHIGGLERFLIIPYSPTMKS